MFTLGLFIGLALGMYLTLGWLAFGPDVEPPEWDK